MKKIIAFLMVVIVVLPLFVSCGTSKDGYTVGICNYVDDASLNQIVDSIKARLNEISIQKNVKINIKYDNCNADANLLNQIISNFISDNVDVMVAIATPVAMAMQAATEDNNIPVVFAAVSDPVGVGLIESNDYPGGNITGTSDYLDTKSVMELMFKLNPDIKKVGLLYDIGQDSSTSSIKFAKTYLNAKGIQFVEHTGTTVDEISLAANAMVSDKVDVVFTPTDNTVMKSELTIYETFANAHIPHFTGANSFALNGAFLGYGVNYETLGASTADIIADIIIAHTSPTHIKVMTFDNGIATINSEICEKLGYDYDTVAASFAEYCTKIEKITTAENFGD